MSFIFMRLCNGSRLVVRGIQKNLIHCEILTGDKKGEIVHVPRITTDSKTDPDMPFVLKRLQFPIRLAFAMTINKAQGQTFENVGLLLNQKDAIFLHGQLYVGLSRSTSKSGIKIESPFKCVQNIVFEEVLN
jgi:ATP-dependent DNA helicase PIF1